MRISDWSSDVCSSDLGQWQRKRPSRPPAGPCRFPRDRHRRLARYLAFTLGNFMTTDLQSTIEAAWDARDTLGLTTTGAVRGEVGTGACRGRVGQYGES